MAAARPEVREVVALRGAAPSGWIAHARPESLIAEDARDLLQGVLAGRAQLVRATDGGLTESASIGRSPMATNHERRRHARSRR